LSTPQPSAATRAPAHDTRAPARVARASAEEPVAGESLYAHAKRSFRSGASAAATAVLDGGIALLQWLRKRAGGAQDADREAGEDRPGARRDRPGGQRDAAAPLAEAGAQAPKRRLRALLVYLTVLLAGGMGGGVLAYDLLEELLDRQSAESKRLEAMVSENSKSSATTQKNLEEAQAGRIEAEKKLEASLAEHTKSAAELQKKLDETEKRLETMPAAERASITQTQRASTVSRGSAARKPPPLKTGNCALSPGNVGALKGCIEDFNR
jgi:hypothetical protein